MKVCIHKVFILAYIITSLLLAGPVFALHPESKIPDNISGKDQASKTLIETAGKYKIEAVFPKDFEEGKQSISRLELAAALHLLVEKLAEKVVKEGPEVVSKEDLVRLNELEEDLRSELLLVRTRSFQSRNEGQGTTLYPISKNISLSGSLVGVFQHTAANKQGQDGGDAVGRGDLVLNFKITDSTIAVVNLRAAGGKGVDSRVASFGGLNGVATDDGDNVRFNKAFVEKSLFDDRLIATFGKISITDYFDNNSVANDESSQFLAGPFINTPTVAFPANGPGVRVHAKLGDVLTFGIGYGSSSASGDNVTSKGFGIAELDAKIKIGELEGNYRLFGAIDGSDPDFDATKMSGIKMGEKSAYNAGVSIDQQLTDKATLFGRYSQRDNNVYLTNRSWSVGLKYTDIFSGRPDDALSVAYGQISGVGVFLSAQEKLIEANYSIKLNDKITLVPIYQHLSEPMGSRDAGSANVFGLRSQVIF